MIGKLFIILKNDLRNIGVIQFITPLIFYFSLIVITVNQEDKGWTYQLLFSFMTAITTASLVYFYNYIIKVLKLIKFDGVWYVLKFGDEFYTHDLAYVELKMRDVSTFSYKFTDLSNLNTIVGKIYINDNLKLGKLLITYEQVDMVSCLNTISEKSVYFDNNVYSKGLPPLIRVVNLNGDEDMTLERPRDQRKVKQIFDTQYTETAEKLANPYSDRVNEMFSNVTKIK